MVAPEERGSPFAVRGLLLLLVFVGAGIALTPPLHRAGPAVAAPRATQAVDDVTALFLALLNEYRASLGLPPLQPLPALGSIAAVQAEYVARTGDQNHDQPGLSWQERFRRCGYGDTTRAGEILGAIDLPAPDVTVPPEVEAAGIFGGFQASPVHQPIMTDGSYLYIGIGRVQIGARIAHVYTFSDSPPTGGSDLSTCG